MCEEYQLEATPEDISATAVGMGLPALPAHAFLTRQARRSTESDILLNDGLGLRWARARLGIPKPERHLKPGSRVNAGVANIRHPRYPDWWPLMAVEHRCVIPASSFVEHNKREGTYEGWGFALAAHRPLFWFAGVWLRWTGVRRATEGEREMDLYAILTTEPNAEVRKINDSMPVILRSPEEIRTWLTAPTNTALRLQQPLPDGSLEFVRRLWAPEPRLF